MPFPNKILQQTGDIGRVIAGKLLQSLIGTINSPSRSTVL
jgi:hypothetical protein